MDKLRPEIAKLIAAKERRRQKLAALPFADKVRMVVQMQQMVAPVLRARGRAVRVWVLDNSKTVDGVRPFTLNNLGRATPSVS